MFRKSKIGHQIDAKALIYKVPGSDFKKGQVLEIPQGYEACFFESDGTQELIQDVYKYKLDRPVQYIYISQSNRADIKTKWGTPNRFNVTTKQGPKTLGAFGHMQFELLNPIRFLEKHANGDERIDEDFITQLVLSHISEAFQEVLPALEPLNSEDEIGVIKSLKSALPRTLDIKLSAYGMAIRDLSIDRVNFQAKEEA